MKKTFLWVEATTLILSKANNPNGTWLSNITRDIGSGDKHGAIKLLTKLTEANMLTKTELDFPKLRHKIVYKATKQGLKLLECLEKFSEELLT